MSKFKYFAITIAAVTITALCVQDVWAKSRSSSSSSSRSSYSSSSKSSSSSSRGWGSSKPKSSTPKSSSRGWGSSNSNSKSKSTQSTKQKQNGWAGTNSKSSNLSTSKTTSVPKTAAEKQQRKTYENNVKKYQTAKASGKHFTTKKDAIAHWKKENAGKYKSTFDSKPATRPDYIPQTTKTSDGKTVNITYNQAGGGYGYTNSLGQFILWDAMTDIAFQNRHMNSYYIGNQPTAPVFVRESSGFGFIGVMVGVIIFGFVAIVLFSVIR